MERQTQTMTPNPKQPTAQETKPYAPSFLDRFMSFVERLPIPYWLTYLALFLVQTTIAHILAWIDGWLLVYTVNPLLLLFPLWQWAPLAIMAYLDSVSLQALSVFSPLLDVEEIELKRLKYEFSTMPSRGVILSGVTWAIVYAISTYVAWDTFYISYGLGPFFSAILVLEGLIAYLTGSAIYYYSLRQLGLVNHTVKMVRQFNLYQLDPVYAFSRVTSLIGVSWMIMLSLTLLLFPIRLVGGLTLAVLILQVVLAVAAFLLPLWFVHRRLKSEKLRLLAESNRQVESTSARLHRCLDENKLGPVTQLKDAMLGLNVERDILNAIPTWPWHPSTLAGFLSVTILPVVLFAIQLVIGKLLGR
jgi:hypothetical protein